MLSSVSPVFFTPEAIADDSSFQITWRASVEVWRRDGKSSLWVTSHATAVENHESVKTYTVLCCKRSFGDDVVLRLREKGSGGLGVQ